MSEKLISMDELDAHNTPESLWVAFRGEVFDVTSFQDEHPGGAAILQENAGKDATEEFDMAGHGPDALEMTRSYVIGRLERRFKSAQPLYSDTSCAQSSNHKYLIIAGIIIAGVAIGVYFVKQRK